MFSKDYQPKGRKSHTAFVINDGNLYMWGGDQRGLRDFPQVHDSAEKMRFTSCVEIFDLSRGKWWQQPTSGKPPLAFYGYSSAVIGNDIYYFGGCCPNGGDGCYHNSIYM